MTAAWPMTKGEHDDLQAAQRQLVRVESEAAVVIFIMSAEEAIKAQRVVREAGRKRRGR